MPPRNDRASTVFEAERLDHQSLRNDRDVMAISGAPTILRPPLHPAWIGRYLDGKRRSRVNHAARRLPLGGIWPAIQRNVGPRKYVGLGKTTAELMAEGNIGQGRVAYEDRVNQRKQNVAMRRRAKYLARSRRMGRQPRKYRSSASRSNDDRFGAGNLETLFGPP